MKSKLIVFLSIVLALFALEARTFEISAWRGETVTFLLPDFCEVGEIPAELEIRFGHLEPVKYAITPNSLERRERYDRVVWEASSCGKPRIVEVKVPRTTKSGVYACGMMRVRVVDRELPPPREWKYYLDLWQHPWAIARIAKVEPFSKAHYAAMRPIYELLASAGQKTITIPILDLPWDHQCRDAYYSLVKDEDFKLFDEYVEFCLDCGIGPDISCYSLCPWKLKLQPGTPEFEAYWAPFMTRFAAHLKEKGWYERTFMSMDERSPAQVKAVVDFVHKYAPGMKIAMAGDRNPADFTGIEIDNYSQVLQHVDERFLAECGNRRAHGFTTTIYTCTNPTRPNTFVDSDHNEAFWLGFAPAALEVDGYLRWAFCSWPENPIVDASYGNWRAGDTFLCYPNGEASIRFLELRNGIVAAEKLHLLRAEHALSENDEIALKANFNVMRALQGGYNHKAIKDAVNRLVNR